MDKAETELRLTGNGLFGKTGFRPHHPTHIRELCHSPAKACQIFGYSRTFIRMDDNQLSLSQASIVIVDDTRANLRLLARILSEQGYNVRPAPNGPHALTAIRAKGPDLVLLDIKMPEMSGYEVCEQLKTDERTRDIPIIFISALNDIFDKVKAFSIGGVDYITKPFQPEEVLARVKAHLTIRQQQQRIQEQNTALETRNFAALELNSQLQAEIRERRRAEAELEKANQELQRLASLDGLTQIANRRRFDEYLKQEWQRMTREQSPLSLLLSDLDDFKAYNDTYGHQAGDECLQRIAQCMGNALKRPADLVARYGGEEFAIILPNTDADGAVYVAKRIQKDISRLKLTHAQSSVSPYITLSIGVSSTIPQQGNSPELLLDTTDKALYEVKALGKNAVIFKPLSIT